MKGQQPEYWGGYWLGCTFCVFSCRTELFAGHVEKVGSTLVCQLKCPNEYVLSWYLDGMASLHGNVYL